MKPRLNKILQCCSVRWAWIILGKDPTASHFQLQTKSAHHLGCLAGCLYKWGYNSLDWIRFGCMRGGRSRGSLGRDSRCHFLPKLPTSPPPHTDLSARTLNLTLFSLYPSTPHCKHDLMWTHNIALCTTMNKHIKHSHKFDDIQPSDGQYNQWKTGCNTGQRKCPVESQGKQGGCWIILGNFRTCRQNWNAGKKAG